MKWLVTLTFVVSIFGCTTKARKQGPKENIYAKLMVASGEGATNEMQCVAEFMKDPDDLKQIALKHGAKVILDGQELKFDDAYYPNYVMERQTSDFPGKHKWTVQITPEIIREYEFEVFPFRITTPIPGKIGQDDLKVACEHLKRTDKVFLMLTGSLSDSSESVLDIPPQDGFFIIPKNFFNKVDPVDVDMHFNISRTRSVSDDDYFGKGVDIEWTTVTKKYKTTVVR